MVLLNFFLLSTLTMTFFILFWKTEILLFPLPLFALEEYFEYFVDALMCPIFVF